MKSNNFKNRLTALTLCFTLLLGAAPITRAYAVNDESDTSSSQSDSDSSDTSSTDSGSKDSKDTKDMTADNDKDVIAAASEAPAVTATPCSSARIPTWCCMRKMRTKSVIRRPRPKL